MARANGVPPHKLEPWFFTPNLALTDRAAVDAIERLVHHVAQMVCAVFPLRHAPHHRLSD